MPQRRQDGFSLLTSTALIALAGAGAALDAVPGPGAATLGPLGLASLPVLGAVLWLRRRREQRVAARLGGLRIGITLPMAGAGLPGGALAFQRSVGGSWRARRDGWQVEVRHDGADWQLVLVRLDSVEPGLTCASATTLDMLLRHAQGLSAELAPPALTELLDLDLCFPLPDPAAPEAGIIAFAEGGYALRGPEGCSAVPAALAEGLIRRGSQVPATPL